MYTISKQCKQKRPKESSISERSFTSHSTDTEEEWVSFLSVIESIIFHSTLSTFIPLLDMLRATVGVLCASSARCWVSKCEELTTHHREWERETWWELTFFSNLFFLLSLYYNIIKQNTSEWCLNFSVVFSFHRRAFRIVTGKYTYAVVTRSVENWIAKD